MLADGFPLITENPRRGLLGTFRELHLGDCLKSLDGGQIKPCEPTKMAKEELCLASGRSNNEYLGSVIRLFQTVSGGNDGLDTSLAFGHGLSRRGLASLRRILSRS
jgi:hypothetical protein